MNSPAPNKFLIVVFLVLLAGPPLWQTVTEARRGDWPKALQCFRQRPTPTNLRAYEQALEEASVVIRGLRPWMQAAQFFWLHEAGAKALVGRDHWLFYRPGIDSLTQRRQPREATPSDAVNAVVDFRNQLSTRGIRLIVLISPNKESVYPDQLTHFATAPTRVIGTETRAFLEQCQAAGVEVVDLFALYRTARTASNARPLYLQQDSHWSPHGVDMAVAAVTERLRATDPIAPTQMAYKHRTVSVSRHGDLVRMLHSPVIESRLATETVECQQVIHRETGELYRDDLSADVLVLGDSFLRIYQQDEPGSAGFSAQLAKALGRPVASLINDGGASTLVRQELFRRPQWLRKKRVVVWEFVERDLRLGTEGWQLVPLPPITSSLPTPGRTE